MMKKRSSIEKELRQVERLLCRFKRGMNLQAAIKRGKCKLGEKDGQMLRGAAQALGWILDLDYAKASKCILEEE